MDRETATTFFTTAPPWFGRPERTLFDSVATRIRGGEDLLFKGGPVHVTASCVVFDPDRTRVLLAFHRKGRFWVQFGGHLEQGDADIAAAAAREVSEESGLASFRMLSDDAVDLQAQQLGERFNGCDIHLDLLFAAETARDAVPIVSDESEAVEWFDLDALPTDAVPGLQKRLRTARERLPA
ncbi:NUDIX hydrolase [Leifsonia sp. NPDC102414]|uniref:NUDIX hydrolase n=1 Tax=Leifsonia sp. NPDC102414 TaxID=3364124 RepID=UPI00380079B6